VNWNQEKSQIKGKIVKAILKVECAISETDREDTIRKKQLKRGSFSEATKWIGAYRFKAF